MKAAVYEGIEQIKVQTVADPDVPEGGMLVKIHGCSVCGSDVRTYYHGNSMIKPPWIIGHETVGEVIENRSKNMLPIGQRITIGAAIPCGYCYNCYSGNHTMCSNMQAHGFEFPGGYAEYMAVSPLAIQQGVINAIADHVNFDDACLTEPLACVLNAQEILNVGLEDRVVVIGTGAIGCMHMQIARVRGATQVIAYDVDDKRLEIAGAFDADHIFNSSQQDPLEVIQRKFGGMGANVVIVACGSGDAQAKALELAGPRGRICNFGGLPKTSPMNTINANLLHYKELSVYGSFSSTPKQNTTALRLISSGKVNVRPLISKRMPLQNLKDAILEMKNGTSIKIVIQPHS
ncbi:zinc-binding dehydrogenase [Sporomusa sphaeroides]|uniref:Sorbitol dehydrogenase n=1 Tax=Sporomusa sphaeroides DSM 2875 TaxID=1337886 RepID=A0ABM9W1Y8_9FIRM|nr:alcohol dehydrogenase catalytic domain-containing protein [Sporomusa sphaeroides]OLS56224.1 sorbitol dehydrogenase [Sporomusa sphaeroides DSM 2875]CVK19134.1 Sorbitol dehydrogenase [Sporomusa sphaeroides DSM 2875]